MKNLYVGVSWVLFQTVYTTRDSAWEMPDWTLGRFFVCRPEAVGEVFLSLPAEQQPVLFERLRFGFENVVYGDKDSQKTVRLRTMLKRLKK